MIGSYKVIVCTPVGRKETLEILLKYMLQLQDIVDEWQLWINVRHDSDLIYINEISKIHNTYIKQIWKLKKGDKDYATNDSLRYFYNDCTDANTIYVKMDDDIVYIDIDGFHRFLHFRASNPKYFLVNPLVVNNIFISWKLANIGILNDFPIYSPSGENIAKAIKMLPSPENLDIYNPGLRIAQLIPENILLDNLYWRNPDFVKYIHKKFLNNPEIFKIPNWELSNYEMVSIHCISWFGSAFVDIVDKISPEDEPWLQALYPYKTGKKNIVFGDCVVSHYSYYVQHETLSNTDILEKYRQLANSNTS
jgi:hypothetical protein